MYVSIDTWEHTHILKKYTYEIYGDNPSHTLKGIRRIFKQIFSNALEKY